VCDDTVLSELLARDAPDRTVCPACGSAVDDDLDLVDKYIAAMRHSEPTRAALAIQVLSEFMGERRAIPPMIALLETAGDAYVLKAAVDALARFADARAVPGLRRLILNPDTALVVRAAAVDALAGIGTPDVAPILATVAAHDPAVVVRERAQQALDRASGRDP